VGNRLRTSIPEGGGSAEKQTLWTVDELGGPIPSPGKMKQGAPVPMTPESNYTWLERPFRS